MAKITSVRTGEYLKESLRIVKEKGGECPSSELIKEMAARLNLSDYEKSLNNTGQYRWVTQFRFYSIRMVKAGLIKKERGLWILADKNYDFESKSPEEVLNYTTELYSKWNASRTEDEVRVEPEIEENNEPEILMQVKPDDIDFQNLMTGISSCKIQIPPFQRSFVWRPSDIRFLLDSIYRGYPIGSFIFWKTTRKLPYTRNVGNINFEHKEIALGSEISYVLDGQQRITSLFAAVKGANIEGERFRFLFDLRSKKFLVSKVGDQNIENLVKSDRENLQISVESVISNNLAAYRQLCRQYGENEEYSKTLDTLSSTPFVRPLCEIEFGVKNIVA